MSSLIQGLHKTYYESGKLQSRGNRVNGMLNGLYEEFYENGNLKHRHHYLMNVKHGFYEDFDVNGSIEEKGNFSEGKRVGVWEIYDQNSNLLFKGDVEEYFYPSGYRKAKGSKDESGKAGEWIYYFDREGLFEPNSETKLSNQFEKLPASKGFYFKDLKHGLWENYYESGRLKSRETFKNGMLEGVVIKFHPNGQLAGIHHYENNLLHGLSHNFEPKNYIEMSWYEYLDEEYGYEEADLYDTQEARDKWVYDVELESITLFIQGNNQGNWMNSPIKNYDSEISEYEIDDLDDEEMF